MENIEKYSHSKLPIQQRENHLFETIEQLDRESLKIFSEIMDLGEYSLYRIENISRRLQQQIDLYDATKKSYDYLLKIEMSSYSYAMQRYEFKEFLTMLTTFYSFAVNPLFGISSFVLLNKLATKSFVSEVEQIETAVQRFEKEDGLDTIRQTLENSNRIFMNKVKNMKEKLHTLNPQSNEDMANFLANVYISYLCDEESDMSMIESLDDTMKERILQMLRKDFNEEELDIKQLIQREKEEEKVYTKKES